MEAPVLIIFAILFLAGPANKSIPVWIFFSLFVIHYVHRVIIFPLRIRTKGKKMPVSVMLMAICFQFYEWISQRILVWIPVTWLFHIMAMGSAIIIGMIIFIAGMGINIRSDQRLLDLRKNGKTGYSIPYGGLFRYISCPNFFGEILEWTGYALLTWCLPTLSFLLWTIFNLVRAQWIITGGTKKPFQTTLLKEKRSFPSFFKLVLPLPGTGPNTTIRFRL